MVSCRPLTAGLDQGPECRKDPSANKEAETQGGEGVVLDLLPGHASQNWAPSLFPGLSPGPAGRDLWAGIQALWELFVDGLQERACLSSASISVTGRGGGGREACAHCF